jgi:hypothetical protein
LEEDAPGFSLAEKFGQTVGVVGQKLVALHELLLELLDFKEDLFTVSCGHDSARWWQEVSRVVSVAIFSQSGVARASESARLSGWNDAAQFIA